MHKLSVISYVYHLPIFYRITVYKFRNMFINKKKRIKISATSDFLLRSFHIKIYQDKQINKSHTGTKSKFIGNKNVKI